jgi:acetyl esterase/lipase
MDHFSGSRPHLALETGGEVYSLDYRLAPENPWPAAIHDVCAVYEELLGKSIPPKQIFFAGDSAGGGLVLSAIVNAKQKQLPMPAGLVLLSPWVDLTNSGWSHDALADRDYVCNSAILTTCAAYYTGGLSPGAGLKSALFADLSDLPPLLIHVGSEEVLLSDSTRLAARAGAAGLRVDLKVWPQMPHVFPLFIEHLAEAAASVREIADWIRGQPVLSD